MRIIIKLEGWITFQQASLKLKKNRNYVQHVFKKHPEYFPEDSVINIERFYFINDDGIESIKKNRKKEVAHPKEIKTLMDGKVKCNLPFLSTNS